MSDGRRVSLHDPQAAGAASATAIRIVVTTSTAANEIRPTRSDHIASSAPAKDDCTTDILARCG